MRGNLKDGQTGRWLIGSGGDWLSCWKAAAKARFGEILDAYGERVRVSKNANAVMPRVGMNMSMQMTKQEWLMTTRQRSREKRRRGEFERSKRRTVGGRREERL